MGKCALCGLDKVPYEGQFDRDAYRIQCPRCGDYVVSEEALRHFEAPQGFVKDHLHLLSAVARQYWEHGERLYINTELLNDRSEFEARILSLCPRSVQAKMDAILRYAVVNSKCPGHPARVVADNEYVRVYCKNGLEMGFLMKALGERKLLDVDDLSDHFNVTVTAEGWTKAEALDKPNSESKQAFVAMWFDKQLASAFRDGILTLEADTGFKMLRIDEKPFNDKICDHIIAEIRRSRFVIADVTGHRHAVYFEAGYAMGLGLPVIWTCRKNAMEETGRKFDTRQYNHITWETPEELREKLKNRILATIGSPR
ncbi:MAG: hypothetical protein ABFD90_09890 [Phycisphaerales bacterium]